MFKYKSKLMSQSQIGKLFGATSRQVGSWLQQIGLRNDEGRPTSEAHRGDYCDQAGMKNGGYTYAWRPEKVIPLLEQAGHNRVCPPPLDLVETPKLVGPFTETTRAWAKNGTFSDVLILY